MIVKKLFKGALLFLTIAFLVQCEGNPNYPTGNSCGTFTDDSSYCSHKYNDCETHQDSNRIYLDIDQISWKNGFKLIGNVPYIRDKFDALVDPFIISHNGQFYKLLFNDMAQKPYEPALCMPGDIKEPKWQNGINKIYSPCNQVNVGIGTFEPLHKLDVRGTSYSNNLLVGSSEIPIDGSLAKLFVKNNTSDILQLGKSIDSEEVYFKVTNDGTVYAKEIWVKRIEDFPDYVFEPGYDLLTIDEVEQHIEQYGRLPKMPEALQVNRDGLDLASTQILLVEKIEELTLYVIQLKKELNQLKAEQ